MVSNDSFRCWTLARWDLRICANWSTTTAGPVLHILLIIADGCVDEIDDTVDAICDAASVA